MANQDTLTFGGIGKDPSGAYTQIETGWNPTYAQGAVSWFPSSASSTAVADTTGTELTKTATIVDGDSTTAGITIETTTNTITITLTAGSVLYNADADYVITVDDADSGSHAGGGEVVADGDKSAVAATGVITLTGGLLGNNWDGTITYKENIADSATYYFGPLCVKGVSQITMSAPASGSAEVTGQFQFTDAEELSIDGVEQATWTDIGSASSTSTAIAAFTVDPSDNAEWAHLDKMSYIRFKVVSTDSAQDGVGDTADYRADGTGAMIQYELKNTLESNTGVTIGGIGADPS